MRIQVFVLTATLAVAASLCAQTGSYKVPRMPDGHPDLQGTYDIATLTPMVRPAGAKATMTKEEAQKLETASTERRARANAPLAADRSAPPVGGTGRPRSGGGLVGGYNNFWLDPGSRYTIVDGQIRTSLIVNPSDGQMPPYTAEAQKRIAAQRSRPTSDAAEGNDADLDPTAGAYDDPERRPLSERCLLGFGSTSGPPALPDYMYNNLHEIVQTPDNIMILTEMVHDARIVRMNAQHLPPTIRKWMGDPVGHWEGDTLVVDTTNFTDKTRFRGSTDNLHVIERFTRVGPKELLYRFTVEDPATWAKPWTGEETWPATDSHIFEYACHESNYALGDILRGARERDSDLAKGAK